ncbi:MAG: uroporphyrinogen decarboxylase family protein [Thermodesulfobacteriota bacterium]
MSKMNSLERVVAAIKFEKPDRVPVTPLSISRSLRVLGYTTAECLYDPEKMARAKVAASERFDDDSCVAGTDLFVESECLGSKVTVYEHTPVVTEYFLKEKSDINKLKVPHPKTDGRMPYVCREIQEIKKLIGDTRVVVPVTGGPLTQASQLFGPEQLLIEMVLDPEWVHNLLRICTATSLAYWEALIKAGAHAIVLLEPFASDTIISPEQYAEFVEPYNKEIFEYSWSQGVVGVNHICADTSLIWEQMSRIGALGLQIDHVVDMAEAKRRVGSKICISGNVHPVDYMLYGTPAAVYWKSREVIAAAAPGSGFVLGSGCDLNPKTPEANILAMIQAGKDAVYNDDLSITFVQDSYPRLAA